MNINTSCLQPFGLYFQVLNTLTIANSLPSWVWYWVLVRIIFQKENAIQYHWPKLSKINWLRILPIAESDKSVSIWIWLLKSKYLCIGALTNAYFSLIKAFLTSKISYNCDLLRPRFLALKIFAFLTLIWFLDLAIFDFLLFLTFHMAFKTFLY